jgi:Flp pilus assembly protein, ATPase CpaF
MTLGNQPPTPITPVKPFSFAEEEANARPDLAKQVGGFGYQDALRRVREELSHLYAADQLTNAGPKVTQSAKEIAGRIYRQSMEALATQGKAIEMSLDDFCDQAVSDLLGMGAIEPLLADATIEDIAINGPSEVMVFRGGAWERTPVTFDSPERLLEVLNRGIAGSNRKANQVEPIADAILPGKQRISIVTYPITDTWPSAVIRIQRASGISLADMVSRPPYKSAAEQQLKHTELPDYASTYAGGMLSGEAAAYLHAAVLAGLNIAVIGPTGVGKTTFLTALGRCIPMDQRMLIIEDTPEININPNETLPHNILYLRTRESTVEGISSVKQENLVRLALRQRPDALTLGEARGAEVFDLLNALNTGHKNGLTSLHSESSDQFFDRIFMMLAQSERGRFLDQYRAAKLVASTLNIVITLELDGHNRKIRSIAELTGRVTSGATAEPEILLAFENTGSGIGKIRRESAFAKKFVELGISRNVYCPE